MSNGLNILLNPVGSSGDVHPLLGLGKALKARGHDVTVMTNDYFRGAAEPLGLKFEALGTRADFEYLLHHPDAWHPRRALALVAQAVVYKLVPATVELIRRLHQPGRTVVVTTSLAFGARVAQDALHVPTVTCHLAPSAIRSSYELPRVPGLGVLRPLPVFMRNLAWRFIDRFMIDPSFARPLNEFRAKLGLAPVRSILGKWWHSPDRVIGLFPPWFGAPQPDWPGQTVLTGFPLFDERVGDLAPDVEAFLAAGDKPIVFTPGSAMVQGQKFFAAAIEACARIGKRAILLTRFPEQLPAELPAHARHFKYVPLSLLLPRAAAMVYHGGVGTCAQAFAAGIPHLVTPMAHDQHDNSMRVQKLGVGAEVPSEKLSVTRLARALSSLLQNRDVPGRCWEIARRMEQEKPIERSCELIEACASPGHRGLGLPVQAAAPVQ